MKTPKNPAEQGQNKTFFQITIQNSPLDYPLLNLNHHPDKNAEDLFAERPNPLPFNKLPPLPLPLFPLDLNIVIS